MSVRTVLSCHAALVGLAIAFAFASAAAAGERGSEGMSDTWVFYTRSVGSAGTLGGSFTPEAALVRTDASIPGIPRIGFFRRPMAAGEWNRLASLVRSLGGPRPSGEHPPGTPMVSLGIMAKGKAEVVHGQAEGELLPAEEEVFSKVEKTVEDVMKHPHRALEAEATWETASVAPDDDLTMSVRVRNPGLGPVPFVHPASRAGDASGFSVVLARAGPDGTTVEAREVVFAPGEVVEVRDGKKATGAAAEIAELAPGREVVFRARARVRLVPSVYRASARLDFDAPPGSDEKAVSGTITVDLPRLAVVRPGEGGGKS
ncbi:MAG: hypothetical protein KJ062_04470 [Thermoanaerobaculia bacterium]|nr:hypothetical protein [Thermoanaerobaculia bacterium]